MPIETSPYEAGIGFGPAMIAAHEVGHSYDIGEADTDRRPDECREEVYSGGTRDRTPEIIECGRERPVMRNGAGPQIYSGAPGWNVLHL